MTLEEKLAEIRDRDIPTASKVSMITDLLIEDLILTLLKEVPNYDRLSEDSDREPQAVQDDVET